VIEPSRKQSKDTDDNIDQPVKIDDRTLQNVTWFTYLGSVFAYDNDCSQDLWTRFDLEK